jgi:NADH:ubiquinone oxidoreductase subunit H
MLFDFSYFLLSIDEDDRLILFFIFFIIKLVVVLFRIAFVTLFERKILSFSQNRLGPNKLVIKGVLQPVFDGVKLLFKELVFP